MRSPTPCRSAVPVSALLALVLAGIPAASAQTAADAPTSAATTSTTSVQLAPLPNTGQFNKKIDFRTRPAGESLDVLIQILARSVGLSAITQSIPEDAVVRYDLGEPKPFREVWDIVLTLNGLEYVLRGDGIVVVGPPEVLAGLQPQQQEAEPRVAVTYPVNSPPSQLQTLLESQFPAGSGVTVTAFEELGLISVRATAAQQGRVRETLGRFDRSKVTQVRRIYPLSYARASNLAGVLLGTIFSTNTLGSSEQRTVSDICSSEGAATSAVQSSNASGETTGAPSDGSGGEADNPLSISADPRTNRLIVTAPVSIQEEIEGLIETLDQPERQINVQVRIQEVQESANERLGIDLVAAAGNFSTTLFSGDATSGLSFIFDAQRAVTGLNLGAILDVFEEQGLSRRVDDSNMTVLNNGVATIQAGGTQYNYIPSTDAEGNSITVRDDIPYGVVVGFTPQITNNNDVILDVCARVDTPTTFNDAGNITNFSTRKANSRVTLEPGQTIVLGGLIQNQLTETTRKVPGLGDFPVVGNLFSTNSVTDSSTELLVIITANVLE